MKNQSIRPSVFILLTLAFSAPALMNIAAGTESATGAGVHLGAAILLAWAVVSGVGHLIDSYRPNAPKHPRRVQQHHDQTQ